MHLKRRLLPVTRLIIAAWLLTGACAARDGDVVVDPYHEYRDDVERGEFRYDDSEDIPWIENETEILALPREQDLRPLAVGEMPDGLQLLVDERRIDVSPKDNVVRLWLVVRSRAGADNGSYEGYRCETGEYKVYAHANPTRKPPVTKAKRAQWRSVHAGRPGNYREILLKDYFCSIRGTRNPQEIRQAMNGRVGGGDTYFSH